MPKIAACIIAKNNEETLPRLLASIAKHVDAIYITDTGSTDRTVAIAKEYGAHISNFKWRKDFSAARNFNFSQVPKEYDYVLWVDTDDEVIGAESLRKIGHEMTTQSLTAVYFTYNYTIDQETGQVLVEHARERLVKRGAYEWKGRVHEVLVPKGKQEAVFSDLVQVNHLPTEEQEGPGMERNLEILQLQLQDEGEKPDPRTEYYLARQYFDLDRYEEASVLFERYLEHSGWDEERAMAWNYLGEICKNEKDYETAIDCYLSAIKERPDYPTWYINLGMVYELKDRHQEALHFVKLALAMSGKKRTAMVMNPRDDVARALETLFMASFHLGLLDDAWAAAKKLDELIPHNEVFEARLKGISDLRRWGKMTKDAIAIAEELNEDQLEPFLNSLPGPVMGNSAMTKFKNQKLPPKKWPEKSIVYFCGKGFEKWDATNLEKGIGGSESAVIYLTREWVKAGYTVTVFGYPHKEGLHDGVDYQFYWRFNPSDTFDVFISWRNETLFKLPIKAKKKLLDMHDVPNQVDFPSEITSSIDHFMVKSKYHTSFLPNIPQEKFITISNGIEIGGNEWPAGERDPLLVSYVSSYDRGLEFLLKMWEKVREQVPGAKLEIAYGWDLFDKIMGGNPERQMWKKRMEELMRQPGIVHRGRISKDELHNLHRRASIFGYYCIFEEINCISVLEAQANGSYPLTTFFAALKETNLYGTKVEGDPYDKTTKEKYVVELVNLLKDPPDKAHRKGIARDVTKAYSWPVIAKEWQKVFDED